MSESTVWAVTWRDDAHGFFMSCDLEQSGADRFYDWVIRHGGRDVQIVERTTITRRLPTDRSKAS